jgi:hypothetical protein
MENDLIPVFRQMLEIDLPEELSLASLKEKLGEHINELIQNDFQQLVRILYRVDVDESKIKQILGENPGKDTGNILAELIIERQLQKLKSRNQYKPNDNIPKDEKW